MHGRRLHAGAARGRERRGGRRRARRLARPCRRRDRGDGRARWRVPPRALLAWLGPAIGPQAYEVGEDVREAFLARDARRAVGVRADAARPLAARSLCAWRASGSPRCGVTRVYGRRLLHLHRIRSASIPIGATRPPERMAAADLAELVAYNPGPHDDLGWIIAASIAGGCCPYARRRSRCSCARAWIRSLISYRDRRAARRGVPRGDAARLRTRRRRTASRLSILGGILAFFVLEKLVLWRHSHDDCDEARAARHATGHDHGPLRHADHGRRHHPQLRRRHADRRGVPAEHRSSASSPRSRSSRTRSRRRSATS